MLPARTLAAIRIILRTGCRPHEILTAELAWVQPACSSPSAFDEMVTEHFAALAVGDAWRARSVLVRGASRSGPLRSASWSSA